MGTVNQVPSLCIAPLKYVKDREEHKMRERAIAFDMETERRKAVRIMIFVLVTAFLIFGLMRGTAGSAELKWKFTPSEQVTYDPLKD